MQKLQQEILEEFDKIYTVETNMTGVRNMLHTDSAYMRKFISDVMIKAYTAGLKRAIDVLPEEEEIGYEEDPYVGTGKLGHNGCIKEAITNITKEMK